MNMLDQLWTLIQYLFLGVFQGFTEPIPISSSGHLIMVKDLFNIIGEKGLTFEVLVNFGSLLAVFIVYRNDLARLIASGIGFLFQKKRDEETIRDFRFIIYLLIGTIPAGVIGVLYGDAIESTFGEQASTVGITLIVTGIALWVIRNLKGSRGDGDMTFKDALIIGLAQSVALIPGISRSGATVVAAMLLGLKQTTALRFSFLLYIPVSLGTVILKGEAIMNTPSDLYIPYVLAFLGSILASYFALKWFINVMKNNNLKYFAFYCFIVGALAILFL
ncbi:MULTISPECIES: undecaprenyl-diphosphate phosphatase [Pontibacillus]|uniref:Undecaprenyl-diphosphatase n=1 Tax=Pontibacillus chungwhensis TaxID=265426 RepID=A0ABY8UZ92_9BACI|nr:MULTISPECIES: undecaprenyl-diphosphate phosphatase [Pontibacillus]MCD5324705.1 undecaprenyl-diphosphate phosphatase [Pontibacillus sp. HN14]WIF99002.1 undecaprenyl-diphosphate phosphatase [Pontibacillus chungwhensis]